MNKKLICLTLSILMLLTCLLTGCGSQKKEEEDESAVDNSAKTITMWLIGQEAPAFDELPQKVQDAFKPKADKDGKKDTVDPETEQEYYDRLAAELYGNAKAEEMKPVSRETAIDIYCQLQLKQLQDEVNEAFTEITKAKFKTNVILKYCTEAEYYAKLEASIEATQFDIEMADKAAKELRKYLKAHKGEKTQEELKDDFYKEFPEFEKYRETEEDDEDAPETEEETIKNEYGIIEIKYPDEKENQVDIFYIGDLTDKKGNAISGYDKYISYYNAEWLSSLSEELSTSSKKLNDYIPPSLLNGVQIEGSVCAIPNNVPIGEYTYMFIDKDLFDRYYHKIDSVKTVMDISTFLNDVMFENGDLDPSDPNYVVPLNSTFEECIKMLCWYWDLSYTDQSVYAMHYDEERDRYYVLKKEYEIIIEKEDETGADGKPVTETSTLITNSIIADQIYKTNEDGKYVDKDGNVLDYTFKVDTEGYWIENGKKAPKYVTAAGSSAMYLVDENGDPVTAKTDRRVILTAEEDGIETKNDEYGNVKPSYIYSFNTDADFSILGALMLDPATRTRGGINLGFESLFTKRGTGANYHELYSTLKDYDYRGYYGTPAEGQSAAVFFQKGDAKILQDYNKAMEDLAAGKKDENGNDVKGFEWEGKTYYVVVAEYPEATEEELYGNMYAVYANSPNLSRAMKVLTYLNTNKEMRDLLQYGVEDVHYELNDDGTVHYLAGVDAFTSYRMKIERTGNCFIATPDETMGPDAWTYAKLQNNDSLINPLLGFDFNSATADSDYSLDIFLIDRIRELNEQTLELIDECTTKEELLALMTEGDDALMKIYSGSSQDKKFKKAINPTYDPSMPNGPEAANQTPDPDGSSPYTVYQNWLTTYGYLAGADTKKSAN